MSIESKAIMKILTYFSFNVLSCINWQVSFDDSTFHFFGLDVSKYCKDGTLYIAIEENRTFFICAQRIVVIVQFTSYGSFKCFVRIYNRDKQTMCCNPCPHKL